MPEATWWVTYHDDYPTDNGLSHVYFANADCGDMKFRFLSIPDYPPHLAKDCLIDHSARIADVIIPESVKLEIKQQHWRNAQIVI
jgi:hypothetical protein